MWIRRSKPPKTQLLLISLALVTGLFVAVDLLLIVLPPALTPLNSLIEGFWVAARQSPALFTTIILWQLVILYSIPVGFWTFTIGLYLWHRYLPQSPGETDLDIQWTPDAVQVRILTIDNEQVVQETVNSLPGSLTDVVVVAEASIDIQGAEVVVVPAEFKCRWALFKGRAIEYARLHHPTDKEYVLYLDEDTRVPSFEGIPSNADIVQFRERPARTGGLLPYLAEIHRIGFNMEQRAFPFLQVPFYAWGGGIAIRRSLENKITWDDDTIVEDSVFTWRAVLQKGATFEVADSFFENQAPPTVWAMISQRRRWLTGTRSKAAILPLKYRILYHFRDFGWALSVFGPFIWAISALIYFGLVDFPLQMLYFQDLYMVLSLTLLAHVYVWSILGLVYYRERPIIWVILLAITPFVVLIHSLGALYGLVAPAKQFAVTQKIVSATGELAETVVEIAPDAVTDNVPDAVIDTVPDAVISPFSTGGEQQQTLNADTPVKNSAADESEDWRSNQR